MAGISVADIKEKRLYLKQIQYLEEQLESCQLKREKLEKENKDLAFQYSVLEKDKRDITEHLKRSLAAKELEVEELQSQQQAINQEGEALKLQHSKQMQVLQERILELRSVSIKQATKFEEQEEKLNKLRQQLSGMEDEESLEKQLVSQRKEHDAVIENLKKDAQLERKIMTEGIQDTVNNCVETRTSIILQNERDKHREYLEQTHFLQKDSETVEKELVNLRDRKKDLCIKRDDLKRDVSKISQERLSLIEELKELKEKCHQMKMELKDCSITQRNLLAKEESLRQDLALASEKCRLQTAKAFQLRAKVESERSRSRQLEKDMQEAVIILRYITKEIQKGFDTQWAIERLLDILEYSFYQEAESTFDNSNERRSQGQKQHTSDPKPASLTASRGIQRITDAAGQDLNHRGNQVEIRLLQPSETDMMEFFLDLYSQPCRSVFMFAKAVKIPFEFKLVDLFAGHQQSEEFGKISMMRRVPVMRDGSFILTESVAILGYLAQKYSVAGHWYPADLQKRARVIEYLAWQHGNLRINGSRVYLLMVMFPVVMGREVPKEKMDAALKDLNQSLNLLEEKFLQNKPFITGDKISVADLVAIVEIMQPVGGGLDVFEGRPKLTAWGDRVKKEVGEKLFDETHEQIMNVRNLVKSMQKDDRLELLKARFLRIFT